jgi:sugar phosphate isomerase/epimerase
LSEIAALQKEYGISCSSYGTYFQLGETPIDELEDYITAAKCLGSNILRLWCGKKSGVDMTDEEKCALVEICGQAATIAARHGVCLCMECHIKTFTEHPEDALWLMQQVDSPHFQMYWQPNQYRTVEENCRSAQILAPYTKVIHVFHWRERNRYPLAGEVDLWKQYAEIIGTDVPYMLEFMPDDRLETLEAEAKALLEILK